MQTEKAVRFVSVMLSALSAGVFFGTRVSLGPSTRTFSTDTYVEVQQATIRNLRPVMGPLLPLSVLVNATSAVSAFRRRAVPASGLTAAGLACQLAALTLTVAVELPINARVMTWAPEAPPEGWEAVRDRWGVVHTARTVAAVLGLGSLVAANLVETKRS